MCYDYEKLLQPFRLRETSISGRQIIDQFYSDRSRIIFSSSFRRLQEKAQVFSLEPNLNVRTRLIHSLEVSDIGRTLASKICNKLVNLHIIKEEIIPQIVAVVENSCLSHDIGNPPFGHFGEYAIKRWSKNNLKAYSLKAGLHESDYEEIQHDFIYFDGNPQGLRTITRLHCESDQYGLNLTYPTILSCIKYTKSTNQVVKNEKAGYFQSEYNIISYICNIMGFNPSTRFPFSYIMEAADDISYHLSDISDGITKGIITADEFIDNFQSTWNLTYPGIPIPIEIPQKKVGYFNLEIAVKWSTYIVNAAANYYIDNHEEFYLGQKKALIEDNEIDKILRTIKHVSKNKIYNSPEAENIELSGYAIITSLLNHFGTLLSLSKDDFLALSSESSNSNFDLERRLYNRLSTRCIKSYLNQVKEFGDDTKTEWWLRVHLVFDHISGMTDAYALHTYQMLEGLVINSR